MALITKSWPFCLQGVINIQSMNLWSTQRLTSSLTGSTATRAPSAWKMASKIRSSRCQHTPRSETKAEHKLSAVWIRQYRPSGGSTGLTPPAAIRWSGGFGKVDSGWRTDWRGLATNHWSSFERVGLRPPVKSVYYVYNYKIPIRQAGSTMCSVF